MPIPFQALTITKDTAGNMIVGDAIGLIHDSVKEGESVVTPMSSSKLFPPMVISMVDVGEETGQLPDMLLKVADVYDDEVDNAVGAMTSMLEPIMIVFLAVVVGGIVFAMFLPLLQVIERWVNPLTENADEDSHFIQPPAGGKGLHPHGNPGGHGHHRGACHIDHLHLHMA